MGDLPPRQALEVERTVGPSSWINLAGQRVQIGSELVNRRTTLRLDGHVLHALHGGLLAKTLPSPSQPPRTHGSSTPVSQLSPAPAEVTVERRVPIDGVVMVARQRLRVGRTYAGRIVTIYVEDTHVRVTYEGAEISLHARKDQHPVTRWECQDPRAETLSAPRLPVLR
ncbi:Mu transposase domain-containing protein [Streptomyces coelicoflavus]|uniref:Mu transposase domain-containing protein n=1 Tax=Streptomyces coelicoflavus TaxID=285562 RepID=UPI00382A1EFF